MVSHYDEQVDREDLVVKPGEVLEPLSPKWFYERAKYIPVRLDLKERKLVSTMIHIIPLVSRYGTKHTVNSHVLCSSNITFNGGCSSGRYRAAWLCAIIQTW